jgi:hypothetical protein
MKVTTVGIDLAKNVFQLHGVNEYGKTVIKSKRPAIPSGKSVPDLRASCPRNRLWTLGVRSQFF